MSTNPANYSSGPGCPPWDHRWPPVIFVDGKPQIDWVEENQTFAKVYVAVYVVLMVATLAWYYRRWLKSSYLRTRGIFLMFMAAVGSVLLLIAAPVREIIGRENLSCDLYLWVVVLGYPAVVWPFVARLLIHYNRVIYNQKIIGHAFEKSLNHLPRSHANVTFAELVYGLFNRDKKYNPKLSFSDTDTVSLVSGESASDRTEYEKEILVLKFYASWKWALLMTILFDSVFLIGILTEYIHPDSPLGKGCTGCVLAQRSEILLMLTMVVLILAALAAYFRVRKVPDPLGITKEILDCFIYGGTLTAIALTLSSMSFKDLMNDGYLSWAYFILFAFIVVHIRQCVIPIINSYRHDKYRRGFEQDNDELDLDPLKETDEKDFEKRKHEFSYIIESRRGRKLFEQHLVVELSVENLYCYLQIQQWKNETNEEARSLHARDIYNTFVAPNSILEINISDTQRRSVVSQFESSTEESPVSHEVFDEVETELLYLLKCDAFPRFQRSKFYQVWLGNSTAIARS